MESSSHAMQKILVGVSVAALAVVLLFGLKYFGARHAENLAPEHHDGWRTTTSADVTFEYPENFSATYVTPVDWPPSVQLVAQPFTCVEVGAEIARGGKTERRTIRGRDYCVTVSSEGAAGSVYSQYAYATPVSKNGNENTMIFTFAARFPQCTNYDSAQRIECENEQVMFDVDDLVARVAATAEVSTDSANPPVGQEPQPEPVMCQMDARVCPDGTVVGRSGPRCEFALCPGAGTAPGSGSDVPTTNTASLNQTVTINSVQITPLQLISDSRCPMNARCVWAGDVELKVRVVKGTVSREVNVKLSEAANPVLFEGAAIALISVAPEKITTGSISNDQYRFMFEVTK